MAHNALPATFGQHALHSTDVLIGWALARGVAAPAQLLIDLLGARDARVDYLGTIVERLASVAPVLSAWSEDAVELHGLARLANAIRADGADLASLPRRRTFNPVMQDFRGQAETHYLYMCWVVHGPVGERALGWINVVRAWLLVQALMRTDLGVWLDDLQKEACLRVREACEETEDVRWLAAIEQLQTPSDDWYRLTQHLHGAVDRFIQAAGEKGYAQRRNWLLVLRRIAAGDSRPQESDRTDQGAAPEESRDLPQLDVSALAGGHIDDLVLVEQAVGTGSWDDAEQDDFDGADVVAIDPTEAPALAHETARQIQLLSGADVRFLAWDWYVLTPPEQDALQRLIRRSLGATEPSGRVIAALVDLAQCLGRSLEMVGRVRLLRSEADPIGEEWAVDIDSGSVRRACPRRPAHWRPGDRERPFINEFADVLTLRLRPGTADVLRDAAARAPDSATVDQLWQALHQGPLESQFRKWCAQEPSLRRVTQGMLSQTLARAFFERSGDHVAARLLASAPRSGLPASTAYTAYLASDLAPGLPAVTAPWSALNVAGGLMDPAGDFLKRGFARAHQDLVSRSSTADFVGFHNAVTHYWDAVWRAATGIRPFTQRWTDINLIDPTHGFVVVDDKSSLQDARTRLVPLVGGLWQRFERSYIQQHLPVFHRWLEANGVRGELSLSTGAELQAQRRPLMFALVAERGSVSAVPVGSHTAPMPPESPLPPNVYRHRLRTSLHRQGVDPEVIDSILGHQDGATATHGDYSMRVWCDDMQAASGALRDIFDELEIRNPPSYVGELTPLSPSSYPTYQPLEVPSAHTAQRSGPSWRLLLRAARMARRIITQALAPAVDGVRPSQSALAKQLADLDADALNRLSARLATSPKGTPTILGPLRYAYFLRLCDRAWRTSDKRPSLRRRFLWRPRDASPYRAEAAKALSVRAALRKELESALEGLTPSKLTRTDALWLALFDLSLCSGVADAVLQAVLIEGKAIRLIELEEHAYLEWNSEGQVDTARSPIQRLRITSWSAHALHNLMQAQRRHVDWQSIPPQRFDVLAQILRDHGLLDGVGLRAVLAALNTVVDQCNVIELPGAIAAHLAGRVRSASLHWGDKLALRRGDRFDASTLMRATSVDRTEVTDISGTVLADDASNELQERPTVGLPVATTVARTRAQIDVRDLFRQVRAELALAEHERQAAGAKATIRRSAGRRINALASATGCSAVTSLIHWCASLLVRPRGHGLLAISTVRRYFAALSPRFEAASYAADLLSMDDEEIAQLYASMMDLPPQSAADYAYARLRDFHGFCEQRFALPDIDWSEVAPEKTAKLAAPGYVHERMYRCLLIEIRRAAPLPTAHSRTAAQALAVLGYRFGLRGAEACGLEIDDCHFDATPPWLSVQKNRLRELKSPAARRTVPLLTRLLPVERTILGRMLNAAQQATAGLPNAPKYLFLDPQGAGELLDRGLIKRTVNALIKDVTGQRHLSVHHLRHSFACNVWDGITAARVLAADEEGSTRAATLLGQRQQLGATRRAPWALARLMGHAHPRTTLFSYVHTLGEAAERLAFKGPTRDWRLPSHALLQVGRLQPQPRPRSQGTAAQDMLSGAQAFSMLMALDRGTHVERLPSRYPVTLQVARRIERIRQEVVRRCARTDEIAEVGLSPRAAAYLVHRGILSHTTRSRGPALRAAIDKLFTAQNRARLAEVRITEEEFRGLFGSKRNISMFRAAQFQLLRLVQEVIGIPQAQLRLAWRLNAKVKRGAVASGWLTPSAPDEHDERGVEFDRVRFDGNPVEHRVVVSLQRTEQGPIRNRWELIAVLLSTISLLTFEAERD